MLLPVPFRGASASHRREFIGQLGHIEKIQTSNRLPFTEKCRNSHARLWTDRWHLPTLIIAIAAGRSHTATATAYDAEVAADDETGKQLEPLPGLPMQRLWRDHTCGRRAKRFHHVGVSLRQVSNFSAKARNGHQRRPFCSDWNSGTPPGMMATVTSVTTPATGPPPVVNAAQYVKPTSPEPGSWRNCRDHGSQPAPVREPPCRGRQPTFGDPHTGGSAVVAAALEATTACLEPGARRIVMIRAKGRQLRISCAARFSGDCPVSSST